MKMTKAIASSGIAAALAMGLALGGVPAGAPAVESGIGQVGTAYAATKVASGKAACKYVRKFLKRKKQYVPKLIVYVGRTKVGKKKAYLVRGYEFVGGHTATSFWYAVTKRGGIYDQMLAHWVRRP